MDKLLIANRGEIAVRIARAAAESQLRSVSVYSEDEAGALHTVRSDETYPLKGQGAAAYLDAEQLIAIAVETGCTMVHPGYGFLSESAPFAQQCADNGIRFVGPSPHTLRTVGDKTSARDLAVAAGVPVLAGTSAPTTAEQAQAFMASLPAATPVMVKASFGGGGRGMRIVRRPEDLAVALDRCQSEASAAFGDGSVFVERYFDHVRHIEIQIIADEHGDVATLWDRDCSVQRRNQKLIEIAPSPHTSEATARQLGEAAKRLARESGYVGAGTVEFLVSAADSDTPEWVFIEINPRLQVEHTVTEEVTGVDIVRAQLQIASGATLASLGIDDGAPRPNTFAIQLRVNAETARPDGTLQASSGTVEAFDLPTGPGVRIDTHCYTGYTVGHRYDPLLAKVIVHSNSHEFADTVVRARQALETFGIAGVATNLGLLHAILSVEEFAGELTTAFVDTNLPALLDAAATFTPAGPIRSGAATLATSGRFRKPTHIAVEEGSTPVTAPMQGVVVSSAIYPGLEVKAGAELFVLESMKMEHPVVAPAAGTITHVVVEPGDQVAADDIVAVVHLDDAALSAADEAAVDALDLDYIRPDLREVLDLHEITTDEARPAQVAKRHAHHGLTARENIGAVLDPGTFVEYGPLTLAARRSKMPMDELRAKSPADGLVCGFGSVNGDLVDAETAECAVMAYDYTVFVGTQGIMNHHKKDRLYDIAYRRRLPLIMFVEGGGGRPGDTDVYRATGLATRTFARMAKLSGRAPTISIVSGRCFAGNAALAGCSDVIIATKSTSIGMGGPAMIEGGGLGEISADEVGPADMQFRNGVIDVLVEDEAEAAQAAKQYLGYFQGSLSSWSAPEQRTLRHVIPENRLRSYDVYQVLESLFDTGSVMELRGGFGHSVVTALARIEGKPVGVLANDCRHLGGAIDSDSADKASRFMQLCDSYSIPIISLVDTPGFMVGRESEEQASVRHFSRMFVVGAQLSVPVFCIVLRKCYGLGGISMTAGSLHAPVMTVSWPTGEYGGMGIEGAVRLGFKAEMEAIADPAARDARFSELVQWYYDSGKASNLATYYEVDDVIDPADTRRWLVRGLKAPLAIDTEADSRPHVGRFVDPW